jgi:hypothetical protein
LSNQDEKRLSDQVVENVELFKEKANPTTKEVTYDEFIAASYRINFGFKFKCQVKVPTNCL